MNKPPTWTVLGSGPLADAVRRTIDADPDRYRPVTVGHGPEGHCPCCDRDVFRVISRHTNWEPGYSATPMDAEGTHPTFVLDGVEQPGCCCVAPNWGPEHHKEGAAP